MNATSLSSVGLVLMLVGVIIIVLAVIYISYSGRRAKSRVKGGGVIMIGPIPIVFGTDKDSLKTILLLSIVLTILLLVLTVITYFSR